MLPLPSPPACAPPPAGARSATLKLHPWNTPPAHKRDSPLIQCSHPHQCPDRWYPPSHQGRREQPWLRRRMRSSLWCRHDRPRAKGAVDCPPCGKTAIFRRVGMSEQWRLAVSVVGFWLCSGRLDQNKIPKNKSGASGLAFLSVTSHLILGNALCWGAATKGGAVSCSM